MKQIQVFRFLFITMALFLWLLSQPAQAAPGFMGWHWETIASGSYASLAVEDGNQAHVAYYNNDSHDLKYALRDATGWQVTTAAYGNYMGLYPSLGLDEAGNPHISHFGVQPLHYSYRDDSGWHTETVVGDASYAYAPLAIDEAGRVHLVYQVRDQSTKRITYAVRVDGTWQTETVYTCLADAYLGCSHIDMALDQAGNPHIAFAYADTNGRSLMYATRSGSGWLVEQASEPVGVWSVEELSLAVDGYFQPHISHSNYQLLSYTFRDTSGWHTEVVVAGHRGLWNDLAVSEGGVPHLAYYDRLSMNLHYAYRDGAGWHDLILDGSGWVGHFPSIVLVHGYPAIVYEDPSDTGPHWLRYAFLTPLDIMPGEFPNLIDPTSNDKVMVVVIGTAELDVQTIDPLTATFGPAGAPLHNGRHFYKDANLDGDLDLALFFRLGEAGIPCGATTAVLQAQTVGGQSFTGWDEIATICD